MGKMPSASEAALTRAQAAGGGGGIILLLRSHLEQLSKFGLPSTGKTLFSGVDAVEEHSDSVVKSDLSDTHEGKRESGRLDLLILWEGNFTGDPVAY